MKRVEDNVDIPDGIGPHEGRELILMLAGKKPMAMFSDVVPDSMKLPIDDFLQYVKSGQIVQFEEIYHPDSNKHSAFRFVYFALETEAWRIDEMRMINYNMIKLGHPSSDETEQKIGYLLGYTAEQVAEFILWQRNLKTQDNLL